MAVLLPVLMYLTLGATDFARAYYTYIQCENGARDGASYAAAYPGDTSGITTRAQVEAGSSATVTINNSATADAQGLYAITVTVTKSFTPITPLMSKFISSVTAAVTYAHT